MSRTCPRCDAPLTARETDPLCSACLLVGGRRPSARRAAFEAPTVQELATRFPDLEVLDLVGQGGMGAVYRARQSRLDRTVALKVLRPDTADDERFGERFLREARVLARLSHPNIVGVHDFGVDGDLAWLTMEYVDGSNLRDVLTAGALPPADAFALVPKICDALQYAHDQGVVHRDIKPENILLDERGNVRIADFGLARLAGEDDLRLTHTSDVFGTPHYMAPEQMTGARDVDHRADIYALGAVFYELLTGELPLGRFEAPSRCSDAVDARIDDVVLRTLAREPASRYQSAREVGDAVDRVARAERDGRPAPGELVRIKETPPHEEALWTALVFACIALAVVTVALMDNPFPIMLLFLPGCAFGAIMATPKPAKGDQGAAVFLLVAAVGIAVTGMVLHNAVWPVFSVVSFGIGVGAGYGEEKKNFAPAGEGEP